MSVCYPRREPIHTVTCQNKRHRNNRISAAKKEKTYRISACRAHGRHYSDHDMFLERKGTWIQGNSEYSNSGDCASPRASEGKGKKLGNKLCQKLRVRHVGTPRRNSHMQRAFLGNKKKEITNRTDLDAGVSKKQKLIETGYQDGP